jgi:outer membrane receptor protein involved in Fe transport
MQMVTERTDLLFGDGFGFVTNAARALSSTAERSGGQWVQEERSLGYIGQLEVGHRDRLHLQLGLRADQNSSFGEDVPTIYLPKIGMSYMVSETDFWQNALPSVSTLRLRAAYGTTGRAPRAGSSLTTFDAAPYHTIDDGLQIGMTLQNPGNSGLKPERGTELEIGADVAVLNDRVGLDVTFYNQSTKDAILPNRLPPSSGFSQDPLQNLGEIRNRGFEARIRGDVIRGANFGWDAQVTFSALDNELIDLGGAQPTLGSTRFQEGFPLAASFQHTLRGFDAARGVAIMSDTMEYMGTPYPRFEGSLSTNITLGAGISLYAQIDGKWDYLIFNSMAQYRDVSTPRSLGVQAPEELPVEERLQRFGPFETESGDPLAANLGRAQYHNERGDHLRFRELALSYTLPQRWAQTIRANRATLNLAVRNLWLWTDYRGLDVDVARFSTTGLEMWDSAEFFVLPPGRRLAVRLNLGF